MKVLYRSKAIREKCMDCCGYQFAEVERCEIIKCPLWPYRFGRNPKASEMPDGKIETIAAMEQFRKQDFSELKAMMEE